MNEKRLIKKYIHHRSLLVKGHSELSLAVSVFNYAMLMWLTLRDIITFPRTYVLLILPGTFVLVFIIQYIIGWIWERKKLVNEEQDWLAIRNPVLTNILDRIQKLERLDPYPKPNYECPNCGAKKGFDKLISGIRKCCHCGYEEKALL